MKILNFLLKMKVIHYIWDGNDQYNTQPSSALYIKL